jgi:group I intron endonuclease
MIYLITNTVNGKQYIGKTSKSLEARWYQHRKNAEYGHNTYLYKSIRKYGPDAFLITSLCEGLDEEEILMIHKHQPEYNMTAGGDGGDTSASPNYQMGMIQRRSYKGSDNPNYGKRGTDSPNYGRKKSEEEKAKQTASEYLKKKRRPVVVNGVYYESVLGAAKALGRSERYVRLHDEYSERIST